MISGYQPKKMTTGLCLFLLTACGGGGGGGTGDPAPVDLTSQWTSATVKSIDAGGLLSPQIKAVPASNGNIHLSYFMDLDFSTYDIRHLVWDSTGQSDVLDESALAAPIDNCGSLGFAVHGEDVVVAYQGGEERLGGVEAQSDAMFSVKNNEWQEYTGAIGFVERNPYFQDGFAGVDLTVASDSQGGVHLAYQFHYEGIDAHNSNFPDLKYVYYPTGEFTTLAEEETVEGNEYSGINGDENSVGHHCQLVVTADDVPAVFYYAELSDVYNAEKGLRMARKEGNSWIPEWVDRHDYGNSFRGIEVGAISAAVATDGTLGVAYYVKQVFEDDDYQAHLRYASKGAGETEWQVEIVDESMIGGKHCSLAFDSNSNPAIAYYDSRSHSGYIRENLKLAMKDGGSWNLENVLTAGNIGKYNSLWFTGGQPQIVTYSETSNSIIFVEK